MNKTNNVFIEKVVERANRYKADSDTDYFLNLLYLGEAITKYTTLCVVSGLIADSNRTKYSHLYQIVRADGIGDWCRIMDEVLIGSSNHLIHLEFRDIVKELNTPEHKGSWKYESVNKLRDCLVVLEEEVEPLQNKYSLRLWFQNFTRIRNKTRGHGAQKAELLRTLCPLLETSIKLVLEKLSLFYTETIYLSRNLSGRYRISHISNETNRFEYLKTSEGLNHNIENGIYLFINKLHKVELLDTDLELSDFFIPNGSFSKKNYESISYISGNKEKRDNTNYLTPPSQLPGSETEGLNSLQVLGNCFTNIPSYEGLYINRSNLESELTQLLLNERHPVITLVGRGGIGKTTLAIKVLHDLCLKDRFTAILWFSARDIDLLEEGAKPVKPQVLGIDEIAKNFVRLIDARLLSEKNFNPKRYVEGNLSKSNLGALLVIIDNFETIENPSEVFTWLDNHIRHPNKILITSRIKDSKGDYPLTVSGMTRDEFSSLVANVSKYLKIADLVKGDFTDRLFQESGGHPYIAKIMLGEVAKEGQLGSIKRIAASKDDLLTALFERTFNMLSPGSKLVFLTLSSWRSIVPAVAVESVIKTKTEEFYEIEEAIEELYRFSFIDKIKNRREDEDFLFLPLAAHLFGQMKLIVSPLKKQISDYVWYLNMFGVGHVHNISKGVQPKIELFFRNVAGYLSSTKNSKIEDFTPILEYICHKYQSMWITLSILYEENNMLDKAVDAAKKFLQHESSEISKIDAWKRIATLSRLSGKHFDEAHALVEICSIDKSPYENISNYTKRIHHLVREKKLENSVERKALLDELLEIVKQRINSDEAQEGLKVDYAWLLLNNHQFYEAKKITTEILNANPNSSEGQRLATKLKMQ